MKPALIKKIPDLDVENKKCDLRTKIKVKALEIRVVGSLTVAIIKLASFIFC